jgi:hypothetical protein
MARCEADEPWTGRRFAAAALPLHERAVLADQKVEMLALLVGELEEDLLAFRVLDRSPYFLKNGASSAHSV